jgi:condensin complex subunit 2
LVIVTADLGEGGDAEPAQEEGINKKDADKKVHIFALVVAFFTSLICYLAYDVLSVQISPASTLESSFEALNVKKFDGMFQAFSLCASVGHIYFIIE